MAIIKCKECGSEVSNKAENCPKCGNPINVKSKEGCFLQTLNMGCMIIVIVFVIVIILSIIGADIS
jgi:hypothetical protein